MRTILVTASDDRLGRKGGLYGATQDKIQRLLGDWVEQKHYKLPEFIDCDPLMLNPDAGKNGRVYKPWIIADQLKKLDDGDFLIYNDCSPELWPDEIDLKQYDLSVIRDLSLVNNNILASFVKWDTKEIGIGDLGIHTHRWFTLESCLSAFGAESYRDSFLCASGMLCIRKTKMTIHLIETWLHYNRMPECSCYNVSETENSYFDGVPGQKLGNRHDQSVLSVILNVFNWDFVDIVYNQMNPYNFLNFCLPEHQYKFINSNRGIQYDLINK